MTMTENGDRGVILSKSLAWSILATLAGGIVSVVIGAIWVGLQVGGLSEVRNQVARNTAEIAAISLNQRTAAVEAGRSAEKVSAILDGVRRIEGRMDRLEQERRRSSGLDQ